MHSIGFLQAAKSCDGLILIGNCFVNFRVTEVKNVLASVQMTTSPPMREEKQP